MTAEPTTPARRGRRPMSDQHRARQRLAISREAIRLFRERGVPGTSGEQIAEAVGVSARTLWRWFRTKESCVEPVLSLSVDGFVASLRRWPAGRTLDEHLVADYRQPELARLEDVEQVLDVVLMSRDEPALRAIWLVVHERAEPVLAGIVAERLGRAADDIGVRVQAAALNAALRIATEDMAAAGTAWGPAERVAHLSAAVREATAPTTQPSTG